MIYTMTCNPSLDYIVTVDGFQLGKTNRTQTEKMVAGGKGINVSMVLQNLGIANIALGFVTDDFTGMEFLRQIQTLKVKNDFVSVANGTTRINMKLKNIDGTEINGKGPIVTKEEQELLFVKLDLLQQDDILILSGSIPNGISDVFYGEIMKRLQDKGVLFVVDATKKLLEYALPYQPFLIKPNNHELGELFGVELTTRKSVVPYAKKIQDLGARNVLVSMAGEGAVFLAETGEVFQMEAPKGTLVYGGGAGDSMVAGFVTGWLQEKDYFHGFKMGVSAGSATAFSEGLATKEVVEAIYRTI
ncbi:1-phosphofructokinase [Chakrabartyella piscis]|uniref:1-phosphofructokinase n=1 Tax=Chakrabartyella piscis TaxID=2918914 RepID=UPI00295835CB|nr:1-phosphofructokinase [Chakrabartyella piscis]